MNKIIIFLFIILSNNLLFSQGNISISHKLKEQNLDRIDSIAKKLNLKGGDIIQVQTVFSVDKGGNISNIHARGPYKLFEEEAIKIISMIPKLEAPKIMNGKDKIKFLLPIKFVIETDKEKKVRQKKEKRTKEKEFKRDNPK